MSNITMIFDGYYREAAESALPTFGGVYTVYRCTHDPNAKTVSIKELLYIGQAQDIKARITGHEKKSQWKQHLNQGEQICYGVSEIYAERDRAEAALIFKHKPPVNTEYRDSFPFETVSMSLSGKTALLQEYFTVTKTDAGRFLYGRYY